MMIIALLLTGLAVLALLFMFWCRLYYARTVYRLRENETSWKRGVWFRRSDNVTRGQMAPARSADERIENEFIAIQKLPESNTGR
jgi:hypothetical protein